MEDENLAERPPSVAPVDNWLIASACNSSSFKFSFVRRLAVGFRTPHFAVCYEAIMVDRGTLFNSLTSD